MIKKYIKKFLLLLNKFNSKKRNKKFKTTDFSIISNNCYAGIVYQHYGLKYNTPTIGLYFYSKEYIKFLKNFDYYIKQELKFIKASDSKYRDDLLEKKYMDKIIGKLDDVEIVFLHYKSEQEAYEKWNRRCKRLSKNIIFKYNDQNLCTVSDIEEFNKLNLEHKICFTAKNIPNCFQIKKYSKCDSIKEDYYSGHKYFNLIDYVNSNFAPRKIDFASYCLASGGAERVICNLANYLSNDEKNEIKIFTLYNLGVAYKLNNNILVDANSLSSKESLMGKLNNSIKVVKKIIKDQPDCVIAFCPTMCLAICFSRVFSRTLKKVKLIISERNNPASEYKNKIIKYLVNFLYAKANIIVFQTNDAKRFFSKKIQKKGIVIPNPINEDFLNIDVKNVEKEKTIVNVGRLSEQKNQKMLINAFNNINKEIDEYKLVIYGNGELKEELIDLTKKLKIEDKVIFKGSVKNLNELLPKATIFVLSSDFEGMPNALMEAMAVGLPCIATDCPCGGPHDLIDENNGVLIPVGDEKALSEKISYLIKNIKFRNEISKNAKLIVKKYNPAHIYKMWKEIIERK